MDNFVYHCSTIKGITEFRPQASTHGKSWVYATKHLAIAATFLGKWNDFDFALGTYDDNPPHLVERYKEAFKKIYSNSKGSIYKLSSDGFLENQTNFDEEVVNPNHVKVIEEIHINNAKEYLEELFEQGLLSLFYYPDRPSQMTKGDNDIFLS